MVTGLLALGTVESKVVGFSGYAVRAPLGSPDSLQSRGRKQRKRIKTRFVKRMLMREEKALPRNKASCAGNRKSSSTLVKLNPPTQAYHEINKKFKEGRCDHPFQQYFLSLNPNHRTQA